MIKNIYKKCPVCKNKRLFIRRREVELPAMGLTALSREKMCTGCYRKVLEAIKKRES